MMGIFCFPEPSNCFSFWLKANCQKLSFTFVEFLFEQVGEDFGIALAA